MDVSSKSNRSSKIESLRRWFSIKGNQSNSNLSGFGVISKSAKNIRD
jgi:hypothetical protein